MQLTCPACGAKHSLEAAINDKAARQVMVLFGRLPPSVAAVMPEYLALFRPAKTGLRWSRVVTVLDELVPMIEQGFKVAGARCRPAADHWRQAIHDVAQRDLVRPLANHNYLRRVVAGLAEQGAASAETAHHQALQAGQRPRRKEPEPAPKGSRTEQAIAAVIHRFASGLIDEAQRDADIAEIRSLGDG